MAYLGILISKIIIIAVRTVHISLFLTSLALSVECGVSVKFCAMCVRLHALCEWL